MCLTKPVSFSNYTTNCEMTKITSCFSQWANVFFRLFFAVFLYVVATMCFFFFLKVNIDTLMRYNYFIMMRLSNIIVFNIRGQKSINASIISASCNWG